MSEREADVEEKGALYDSLAVGVKGVDLEKRSAGLAARSRLTVGLLGIINDIAGGFYTRGEWL